MIPVIWNSRNDKAIMIESRSVVARGAKAWGEVTDCKGAEGNLLTDGNILWHNNCSDYTTISTSQNSSNCTLKNGQFIVCKVHFKSVWL